MATFSTWTALKTAILDKLQTHAEGDPLVGSYQVGEHQFTYRSYKDLIELLVYVEKRVAKESAEDSGGFINLVTFTGPS